MALFGKRYHPAGTSPGTLTKERSADAIPFRIRLVDFDADEIAISDDVTPEDCEPYLHRETTTWIHVSGHPAETTLRELGTSFGLHSLALEDVLNIGQRPKVEPFEDQLFIIMSLPMMEGDDVDVHQVSLFVGENYVISFCEADPVAFAPIVKRLKTTGSRMRSLGADYLMYSILDAVIDHAFPIMEAFGLQLEDLEEKILDGADHESLEKIHLIRRELILMRRKVWPQREVINQLLFLSGNMKFGLIARSSNPVIARSEATKQTRQPTHQRQKVLIRSVEIMFAGMVPRTSFVEDNIVTTRYLCEGGSSRLYFECRTVVLQQTCMVTIARDQIYIRQSVSLLRAATKIDFWPREFRGF